MALIHPDFVAVRFHDTLPHAERSAVAESCHLAGREDRQELPGESFTLFRVAAGGGPRTDRHGRAMRALAGHRHVVRAAPVFGHGAVRSIATDRIWIGLRGPRRSALDGLLRHGARLLESSEAEREYLVELPARADPARICRQLAALVSVAYAEPDHVLVGRRFAAAHGRRARSPEESQAFRQIGMDRAWRLQRGHPAVTIALLDDGVLASHPDLAGTVVARYDATRRGTAVRPRPWDGHGTECAALAAGSGRRRDGIRGVAAGCGIVAVRVGCTPTRFDDYVTKASWLRRGVDWAWQHGAAVLSMSFGGGPPMMVVTRALQRARARGRGGQGCVLVAAAGNSGRARVEYPAMLDGVMAVAATDQHNRPASFSNRGRAIAIAAPGVNIRTATIPDPAEQELAWYRTDSGTSLAVPLVAGGAALVLCRNPALSERQVRDLLCATASRRGGAFIQGRNDRVGSGRLDVGRAVAAARTAPAVLPGSHR